MFRNSMRALALLAATSAVLVGNTDRSHAQTKWNFANAYAPTEFQSEGFERFAKTVKDKSGGKLDITVHHNGSLFANTEILQATRDGLVEIGTQLMTNLGRENALWELDGVPFFVTSYDEAKKLWAASRPRMNEILAQSGLRLLFAAPWPTQGFFFSKPVNSLADVKGVKMRAYNPSTTRLATLMGAAPASVQMTEAPQAFATGLIGSLNTSPTSAVVYNLWNYSKYYLKTDAWVPKQMVFVREEKFKSLSPDLQKAVLDAAADAEEWIWARSEALVSEAEKALADKGMTIVKPQGAFAAELKGVGDVMLKEWMTKADDKAKAVVEAMRK